MQRDGVRRVCEVVEIVWKMVMSGCALKEKIRLKITFNFDYGGGGKNVPQFLTNSIMMNNKFHFDPCFL